MIAVSGTATGAPHPLVGLARRLDRSARHHKREAQRHRNRARELRQRQAEIEARLAKAGVELTYETQDQPHHGEGAIHGRHVPGEASGS